MAKTQAVLDQYDKLAVQNAMREFPDTLNKLVIRIKKKVSSSDVIAPETGRLHAILLNSLSLTELDDKYGPYGVRFVGWFTSFFEYGSREFSSPLGCSGDIGKFTPLMGLVKYCKDKFVENVILALIKMYYPFGLPLETRSSETGDTVLSMAVRAGLLVSRNVVLLKMNVRKIIYFL